MNATGDGGRIDGVFLQAAQPEGLASWYSDTLGVHAHSGAGGTALTGQGDSPDTTTWDLSVVVTDLAAAQERLRAAGAEFTVTDHGDVLARDPAGHLLRIHATNPQAPVIPDGIAAADEPEPVQRRVPARALALAFGAVVLAGLTVIALDDDQAAPDTPQVERSVAAAPSLARSGPPDDANAVISCELWAEGDSAQQRWWIKDLEGTNATGSSVEDPLAVCTRVVPR